MAGQKQLWEVVGGQDKGGILVKESKELSSAAQTERLSTGALIEEINLDSVRLHYKKLTGTGPYTGWISIKVSGKDLAVKTDRMPSSGLLAPAAAAPGELPSGQPSVFGPSGVPRKLLPASELTAKTSVVEKRLRPQRAVTMKEKKLYWERCAQRLQGELYGLPFAQTPEEFVSPSFGADWLTEAFHRAGTLPEDNRVSKITWWRRFPGGGSGPKTLFVVEYEKPDEELDTMLFLKQPHPLEEDKENRFRGDGLCIYGDVFGGEINFYVFVSPFVPFPVPKLYFADLNRDSTESCVINHAVEWPSKGKTQFGPYEILPPCEKCEDWRLTDSHEYYFAMMKRMGTIAGLEKTGKLGPYLNTVEWSPSGPDLRRKGPGAAKSLTPFVEEVAPQIWPAQVKSKSFLKQFEKQMDAVATITHILQELLWADPLYIGFGHANGNSDNAYFYRDSEGVMECGFYDWGQTGYQPYAMCAIAGLTSSLGEMLVDYEDRLMHCFADAYHDTGAPSMDVEKLISGYYCKFACQTESLLISLAPYLSEKHPQGRPFWKSIKSWNDAKITADFSLKFGVSMFYNLVVRWSLRSDTYWSMLKKVVQTPGLNLLDRMRKEGISTEAFE